MKERAEIASYADAILSERRFEAEKVADERRREVASALPEYEAAETRIREEGLKLVRLAVRGQAESEEYRRTVEELERLGARRTEILTAAGYPADYIENCHTCKKCRDKGYLEDGNGVQTYCECYTDICKKAVLEESGIPVKKGFEAFDAGVYAPEDRQEALEKLEDAKRFTADLRGSRSMLFYGKAGSGKTYLASLAATEAVRQGFFTVYATVPLLMQNLLYYGDDERALARRDQTFEIIHSADLLILDELGTERMTPARMDMLSGIIDGIVTDSSRKCIVISNLTLPEILENYGERIFSRLAAMQLVKFDFEASGDLRLRLK